MSAPRVVVIVHDEWILQLLQDGLREGGFVVATATSGEQGLARVRELAPDCVLCDVSLPEKDGYAIVTALRADASVVPIALLAPEEDGNARTAAFEAGADALLIRPFRLEEVVAQMNALVQLARRMRERRNSLIDSLGAGPPSSPDGASFRGELEHMPLGSMLTLLELERKTGSVSVRSSKHRATLELTDGHIVSATLDASGGEVVAVLREALGWTSGRITFRAKPHVERTIGTRPIRALLAEARRQQPTAAPPVAPSPAASNAPTPPNAQPAPRAQAIPPPPGQRKPALGDIPTRKLQPAELAPQPQPVHDKPADSTDKPNG